MNFFKKFKDVIGGIKNQPYSPQPDETPKSNPTAKIWEEFNSLPKFEISFSGQKNKVQPVSFLKELKYSNLTLKTKKSNICNFVVIDIETTGLSVVKDDVLEIAAVKYINFEPAEIFHTYISPKNGIKPEAFAINKISDDMLAEAPQLYQVIPSLQEFIKGYSLVAHNFEFDFKFLCRAGLDIVTEKRKYFDTLIISQKHLKKIRYSYDKEFEEYLPDYDSNYDVEDYKLETLCDYYGIIRNEEHRALSDCFDTGRLFIRMADDFIE